MLSSVIVLATLLSSILAIPTIETKGSKFFTSDGNQWYIKGIAYQLTEDDPLAQGSQCQLDASLMKTLGANAIRVYHVDPSADHDACMSAFSDAGIYVFLDLDTFDTYILPEANKPQWNGTQFKRYAEVMDAFHNYDNVAGFFVGNEGLNTGADSVAAPYVKASARDMKAHRDSMGYRKIPVGYSATDAGQLRPNLQNYLACGSNASEALDFFSLNAYEWCGDATFEVSGYQFLQMNASEYNIPIFFSETGCNTVKPRTFQDQSAILGPKMMNTWSGAIIYEWIEETNNYGLISYGPKPADGATGANIVAGFTRAGTPTPVSPDFENLKSQWATLAPTGVSSAAYSPSLSPPACPSSTSGLWNVDGNVPLPTVGQEFMALGSSNQVASTGTGTDTTSGSGTSQTASSASGSSPSASETKKSSASASKRDVAESNLFRLLVQTGLGLAAMAVFAGLM
ncbi:related to beta (1-3) glucanosyltransferase [Ramularia collo-cygni]|uniref:1,3-beta-glucanosyltransferase n=1 Tax=Ramularia collo-cygni TaxID=112498 RepID=A0A2D3V647_9PEZI|nr:related to beta (1-3) glucanosyltransferase [Ramularia collo-cygni]CZT20910.1 related to beta (1-3) glucanosyltransferase [Ramularia collo-cygni]